MDILDRENLIELLMKQFDIPRITAIRLIEVMFDQLCRCVEKAMGDKVNTLTKAELTAEITKYLNSDAVKDDLAKATMN